MEHMNKAEKLEIASYIAPILRNVPAKTLTRRVKLYSRETGEVTGEATAEDALRGLAKIQDLEHVVEEGVRPVAFVCKNCGKVQEAKDASGVIPTVCYASDGGCYRQKTCAGWGKTEGKCTKTIRKDRFHASEVRRRGGGPALCTSCAGRKGKAEMDPDRMRAAIEKAIQATMLTPEELADRASSPAPKPGRKGHRKLTPDERSAVARKAATSSKRAESLQRVNANRTPEQRLAAARKASETKYAKPGARPKQVRAATCAGWGEGACVAVPPKGAYTSREIACRHGGPWRCRSCANKKASEGMGPEKRSARAKRAQESHTPEQHAEIRRRVWAQKSSEERSEIAHRAWETRRARRDGECLDESQK